MLDGLYKYMRILTSNSVLDIAPIIRKGILTLTTTVINRLNFLKFVNFFLICLEFLRSATFKIEGQYSKVRNLSK